MNDLKKQLSTTVSIIFSSLVFIFGGPMKFGITILSLYLKKIQFSNTFSFRVMFFHSNRDCLSIELNVIFWTYLKLFPIKCLAKWSMVSFSKNTFRFTSVVDSFGGGSFGKRTMVILFLFYFIITFDSCFWLTLTSKRKTEQQFRKPYKSHWNYWNVMRLEYNLSYAKVERCLRKI